MGYNRAAVKRGPAVQQTGQRYIDIFMLAMGIVLGFLFGLVFMVSMKVLEHETDLALNNPEVQAEVSERVQPIGMVLLLGDPSLKAAPPPPPAPARVNTVLSGPQVYNEVCNVCHAPPGIGGAPPLGDTSAWTPRISQGLDMLTQHAIEGFQGSTGVMPPKGGRVDLSDAEIRSAVEFMVGEANGGQ